MSSRPHDMTIAVEEIIGDAALAGRTLPIEFPGRRKAVSLAGRLVTCAADHPCRVRNISAGGMMVECDDELAIGEPVRVELRNFNAVEAKIVWIKPPRLGLEFLMPVNVETLIDGADGQRNDPVPSRAPRLLAGCQAMLGRMGMGGRDMSEAGYPIKTRDPLPIGVKVQIDMPGFAPLMRP